MRLNRVNTLLICLHNSPFPGTHSPEAIINRYFTIFDLEHFSMAVNWTIILMCCRTVKRKKRNHPSNQGFTAIYGMPNTKKGKNQEKNWHPSYLTKSS